MKKYLFLLLTLNCAFITVKAQTQSAPNDSNVVYTQVEIEPIYPGGMAKLFDFISNNTNYPSKEKAAHIQGRVILQFVVEKDGSLSDIHVIRTPSDGLGTEATRLLLATGKWTPGVKDGKKVRVQFTLPINFSLSN